MNRILISALLFFALYLPAARASTDYVCFDTCVKGGQTTAVCLPKCMTNQTSNAEPRMQTFTDYRCVTLCVNGGKGAATCLPQCSYEKPMAASSGLAYGAPVPLSHKPLEAPRPIGDTLLMPQRTGTLGTSPNGDPSTNSRGVKDYTCINQCMQTGMQSETCMRSCSGGGPRSAGGG